MNDSISLGGRVKISIQPVLYLPDLFSSTTWLQEVNFNKIISMLGIKVISFRFKFNDRFS